MNPHCFNPFLRHLPILTLANGQPAHYPASNYSPKLQQPYLCRPASNLTRRRFVFTGLQLLTYPSRPELSKRFGLILVTPVLLWGANTETALENENETAN